MINENMFLNEYKTLEIGPIAVAGNVDVYSDYFELPHVAGADFSLVAQASGTTIDTDVSLEIGDVPPVAASADVNYAVPDDMSAILEISDTLLHRKAVAPTLGKYGRFLFSGGATNTSDVVFTTVRFNIVKD